MHASSPSPSGASRAVFVVGAGRSGTSAIVRGLSALGVELGDHLKSPTAKNPTGFFEDVDLLRVAKQARAALGLRAESVALVDEERFAQAALDPLVKEAVAIIEGRFARYPLWGFKYAQTLRFLPFWEQVFETLDLDVRFVVAARNPLSVARSRAKLDPIRGIQEKSDLEWLVNVVPYFRRLAHRPFVVTDYDLLMAEPAAQLERLAERLHIARDAGVRAGVDAYLQEFLAQDMRHTRFSDADLEGDPRLNPLVRDGYRWLYRLATDAIAPDHRELWRDWVRLEAATGAMAPALRLVDRLEAELRSRRGSLWQRIHQRLR